MKTFAALIRRYVLATAAIVLLVGGLLVGQIFYVGFKSNAVDATGYRGGALADALKRHRKLPCSPTGTWPITPCSAGRRITGCLLWRNRLEPAGSITST